MKSDSIFKIDPVISFLSQFIEVTEEERQELEANVNYLLFKKGEIIHKEGEVAWRMGIIIQGAVRAFYYDENGEEHTVEFAFEGSDLSDFKGFNSDSPALISAQALEDTYLASFTHAYLEEFVSKFPRYFTAMPEMLTQATDAEAERAKMLRISSSRLRYEKLCELRPEVVKRVPLTYIASFLNMALGTLSRVRAGKL